MYGASSGRPMIALKFLFSMTTITMWSKRGNDAAACAVPAVERNAPAINGVLAVAIAMTRRAPARRSRPFTARIVTASRSPREYYHATIARIAADQQQAP